MKFPPERKNCVQILVGLVVFEVFKYLKHGRYSFLYSFPYKFEIHVLLTKMKTCYTQKVDSSTMANLLFLDDYIWREKNR